jgi:hypothetical protein
LYPEVSHIVLARKLTDPPGSDPLVTSSPKRSQLGRESVG